MGSASTKMEVTTVCVPRDRLETRTTADVKVGYTKPKTNGTLGRRGDCDKAGGGNCNNGGGGGGSGGGGGGGGGGGC